MENKLKYYVLLLPLAFCIMLKAQVNLVPNGSFEIIDTCPLSPSKINYLQHWFSPSIGTPDLFNSCAGTNQSWSSVPDNSPGYQYPFQGEGYVGIGTLTPGNLNSREYIGVKLTQELTINKFYCFTMYCSLFDLPKESNLQCGGCRSEYTTTNIGVYFSPDSIFQNSWAPLPYTPQIQNPITNKIVGYDSWVKVQGIYKATDKDNYIYIGNFYDNANTVLDTIFAGANPDAWVYFYIDSVSLVECTGVGVDENSFEEIKIYPNPANDFLTLNTGDLKNIQVEFFDISGRKLFQQKVNTNQESIDVSALANGLYVCTVYSGDKVVRREKVVVSH